MGIFFSLRNFFSSHKIDHTSTKRSSNLSKKNFKTSFTSSKKGSVVNNYSKIDNGSITVSKSSVATSPDGSTRHQASTSNGHTYKYKDGRRYHADESVAYVLPNDDDEADRVHEQHWILRYALQGNFFAPVTKQLEEGIKVLDSGCGPATWAFEMGETYPRSKIHGIDASYVFPEDIKPANVEFLICNIAQEIPYEDNYFDYIHQRLLLLGLTSEDWTNTLVNLYRVLKPGGYIELAEPDFKNLLEAGPGLNFLQTTLSNMSATRGLPTHLATELEGRLIKAGFVDVVVRTTDIPLNHSGKVGELLWGDYKHVYLNLKPVMAKVNPAWEDSKAYEAYINQCGEEAKNSKTSLGWYSVYARKPEEKDSKINSEQQEEQEIEQTKNAEQQELN